MRRAQPCPANLALDLGPAARQDPTRPANPGECRIRRVQMSRTAYGAGKTLGESISGLGFDFYLTLNFTVLTAAVEKKYGDYASDFWDGFNAALGPNPTAI
jgi:hypothetical protein